ncbi:hypothetical protein GCM10010387_33480 [Streptomyces inusitatus]|uniref:Phospholipase n=1 Tax=Streptomyces inusitatus TaxID=68221 RepID=A0A918UUM4_9ACTN|nr:phospholipase A2 [Streptomyces inusitatus]GGZ36712.1 hypothetical protein GCM10010387_33480 [Streptomyces inusitatus]
MTHGRKKSPLGTAAVSAALALTALAGTAGPAEAAASRPVAPSAPVAPLAPAVSPAFDKAELKRRADRVMALSYKKFAKAKRAKPFDWRADGCSVPMKDFPYKKKFRRACDQHDFGYRNYGARGKLELSPTRATRKKIDGRFLAEMRRTCNDTYKGRSRTKCRLLAANYYLAVRAVGGKAFGYR